jgi:selenide,water dikinase
MEFPTDANVIVGLDSIDDAGVYKINAGLAIVQTVDFFTPIVDDPYWFGQIAAANALSDIYAMGGIPKTAMNLVAFPADKMDISILRQIIKGGIDKMREAHVVLLGGHSVEDNELKYGLSVTGFIHPDKIIRKNNLILGDKLILTKPLGTGIINTAIKAGIASPGITETVTRLMATLNQKSAQIMQKYPVHACTDITGFGLLGHIAEMLSGSVLGIKIDSHKLPIIPGTDEYAQMGLIPAGAYKNRKYRETMVDISSTVDRVSQDILFDPQTSGGLLICIDTACAGALVNDLKNNEIDCSAIIGEVVSEPKGKIVVF